MPLVTSVPVTGIPEVFVRRSRNGWTVVQRNWRSFLVDKFVRLLAGEETRYPLEAAVSFRPVAGNPLLSRRNRTPDTTHPKVTGSVFVPPPVTWDPNNVVALRFVLGRNLINRFGWRLSNQDTQRWVRVNLLSKRFMNRTTRQRLGLKWFCNAILSERRRFRQRWNVQLCKAR